MSYNGRSQKTILQPDDLLRSLAGRNVKDMKIVFLDDNSIGTDIDLSGFEVLGEVVRYGSSKPEEVPDRVQDADVVIVNKMEINEQTVTWYKYQEVLQESAVTSVKRPISGGWGFGGDNSISIAAAALALWGCRTSKRNPNRKMRIG